ncbi:MAG: hypothetical protein DRN24_02145 [Thermoplasmata archaeon]|nr:MAG: hypothetical protein DRN24_02145 [Thermoplasmata archaeon]
MDEGYILSNKYRRILFDGLSSGETDLYMIAKKHHIVLSIARKITEDFIKQGIVEKKNGKYVLTKEGEKIADNIKG